MKRLKEPSGRLRFLSDDERTRLLEACQQSKDRRLHPLVVFGLATGARQGELLALRWGDVDLKRGRAVLHDTKNADTRTIYFPGAAGEVLRAMPRYLKSDYVFGIRGPKRPKFPRQAWNKALENAKIDDFTFHGLRHSFASYLAMQGASLVELKEALGHRSISQTVRYAHLTRAHSEEIQARMVETIL